MEICSTNCRHYRRGRVETGVWNKNGLYQPYNILLIAGTKDFPTDHIDGLKLPFGDTLNTTHRGRTADAYYV